jgi:hypothetical protein
MVVHVPMVHSWVERQKDQELEANLGYIEKLSQKEIHSKEIVENDLKIKCYIIKYLLNDERKIVGIQERKRHR